MELNFLSRIKFISKKKSSLPHAALDLAKVEKGEVIPDNTAQKCYLENYY